MEKNTHVFVITIICLSLICVVVFYAFCKKDVISNASRTVSGSSGGHTMTEAYMNNDVVAYYSSVNKVSLEINRRIQCISLKSGDRALWETDISEYIKERHYSDFKVWRVVCHQKYIIVSWDKHSEIIFDVVSGKILGVQAD